MTTWLDYRDGFLRYLLGDEKTTGGSSSVVFDDAALLAFANQALRVLDGIISPIAEQTLPAQSTHNLPANFVAVVSITSPTTGYTWQSLTQVYIGDGTNLTQVSGNTPRFYILHYPTRNRLTIVPTPTTTMTLRYRERWPAITGDSFSINFSPWPWLESTLAYYIGYLAYTAMAARRARLEPFSQRPELNVGNPLEKQAEHFYTMYQRALQAHGVRSG